MVSVRVLDIGPEPTVIRTTVQSVHPDLQAQYQLDLGYCAAGTTVWLSRVHLREVGE